jgi:PAS domain S-box-containing protein
VSDALRHFDELIKGIPRVRRVLISLGIAWLVLAFLLRLAVDDPHEPAALIFAPGVALLALELGVAGGAVGAVAATGLVYASHALQDSPLTIVEVLSRALPFLVLGFVIGALVDRLRDRERRFRSIVETADEGIWVSDAAGRTTWVNDRLAEMLGYTPEELYDLPVSAAVADGEHDVAAKLVERSRGRSEQYDLRLRRKNGTELWALVSSAPLHDARGRFVGALAMIVDITQRKHAEEQLRERDVALVEAAAELELSRAAQRQAAEVNDTIVQRLALAKYAADAGDTQSVARLVDAALADGKRIVADLLHAADVGPGDLRRDQPALSVRDGRD